MEIIKRTSGVVAGNKNDFYAGVVWIVSGTVLSLYGIISIFNARIPGVENIINFLLGLDTHHIYIGAFLAVLIEGLYIVGSFFPGASLVIIFAIIAQTSGFSVFAITIALVFIGWCIAGLLNIYGARIYRVKMLKREENVGCRVDDKLLLTWFPAFRASHEVAQVVEGAPLLNVLLSSLRVRVFAVLFVASLALVVPLFIDLKEVSRDESRLILCIVIVVSFFVGISKIKGYRSSGVWMG